MWYFFLFYKNSILQKFYFTIMLIFIFFTMTFKSMFLQINLLLLKNIFLKVDFKISFNVVFLILVMFISLNIIFFSSYYMEQSKFFNFFLFFKIAFIFSMLILILSNNYLLLFIGWDGLGITSYFLVIFYQNWKSFNAGMLTILSNRLGDAFLMIFFTFFLMMNQLKMMEMWMSFSIFFLMIFSSMAFTKSAQFPFSSWLPAAMAAPTPISALVHSSTLVTAGVFVFIQFFDQLLNKNFLSLILFISVLTLFYSGSFALWENDLKKIVALSTLNQLALMFFSMAANMKMMSYFHLNCHALFKSLLFMNTGILIHFMYNNQDSRTYTLSPKSNKFLLLVNSVSIFNLMGLSLTSGFFSKDFILESMFFKKFSLFIIFLFFLMMSFTFFYALRILFSLTFSFSKLPIFFYFSKFYLSPLMILSIVNIFFGKIWFLNYLNLFWFCGGILKIKILILTLFVWYFFIFFKFFLSLKEKYIKIFSSMFFLNFIINNFTLLKNYMVFMFKNIYEKGWLEIFFSQIFFYKSKNFFFFFYSLKKSSYWVFSSLLFFLFMLILTFCLKSLIGLMLKMLKTFKHHLN